MIRGFFLSLALLFILSLAGQAEISKQQIMQTLQRSEERLWKGDISALDDVKALPGDDAVAGLLMFFKQYFYVFSKETQKKAIAAKAAQYVTECPTAGDYIKRLFKKEPGRQKSGLLTTFRQTTLDSLSTAKNPFAVRLLFELIDEPELDVPAGDFSTALAKMDLPSAPFTTNARRSSDTPEGLARWKEWWTANKEKYGAR